MSRLSTIIIDTIIVIAEWIHTITQSHITQHTGTSQQPTVPQKQKPMQEHVARLMAHKTSLYDLYHHDVIEGIAEVTDLMLALFRSMAVVVVTVTAMGDDDNEPSSSRMMYTTHSPYTAVFVKDSSSSSVLLSDLQDGMRTLVQEGRRLCLACHCCAQNSAIKTVYSCDFDVIDSMKRLKSDPDGVTSDFIKAISHQWFIGDAVEHLKYCSFSCEFSKKEIRKNSSNHRYVRSRRRDGSIHTVQKNKIPFSKIHRSYALMAEAACSRYNELVFHDGRSRSNDNKDQMHEESSKFHLPNTSIPNEEGQNVPQTEETSNWTLWPASNDKNEQSSQTSDLQSVIKSGEVYLDKNGVESMNLVDSDEDSSTSKNEKEGDTVRNNIPEKNVMNVESSSVNIDNKDGSTSNNAELDNTNLPAHKPPRFVPLTRISSNPAPLTNTSSHLSKLTTEKEDGTVRNDTPEENVTNVESSSFNIDNKYETTSNVEIDDENLPVRKPPRFVPLTRISSNLAPSTNTSSHLSKLTANGIAAVSGLESMTKQDWIPFPGQTKYVPSIDLPMPAVGETRNRKRDLLRRLFIHYNNAKKLSVNNESEYFYSIWKEDKTGNCWFTAAFYCPAEKTLVHAQGGGGFLAEVSNSKKEGMYWYGSKDDAVAAAAYCAIVFSGASVDDDTLASHGDLPILRDDAWLETHLKLQRCAYFPHCRKGTKCNRAHVYIPSPVVDSRPLNEAYFWNAYSIPGNFSRPYGKQRILDQFSIIWRTSADKNKLCTAALECPDTYVIYYAMGRDGKCSEQNIWWYKSEKEAKRAVISVAVDHFVYTKKKLRW